MLTSSVTPISRSRPRLLACAAACAALAALAVVPPAGAQSGAEAYSEVVPIPAQPTQQAQPTQASAPSGQSGADAYSEDVPIPAQPAPTPAPRRQTPQRSTTRSTAAQPTDSPSTTQTQPTQAATPAEPTPKRAAKPRHRSGPSGPVRGDTPQAGRAAPRVPLPAAPTAATGGGSDSVLGLGIVLLLITVLLTTTAGFRRTRRA
jgi:hypothetical protein